MRQFAPWLAAVLLAGCSGDKHPDVTKNPVWGPAIQARRQTENIANFANDQLQRQEQAIKNAGASPDQINQGR
jgi:hypothetical protein